jgi:hypothetical protein
MPGRMVLINKTVQDRLTFFGKEAYRNVRNSKQGIEINKGLEIIFSGSESPYHKVYVRQDGYVAFVSNLDSAILTWDPRTNELTIN